MLHIWISSDDRSVQQTITKVSKAFGHAVEGKTRGSAEVWEEVEKGKRVVLISDIGSRTFDGLSLIRQIDERNMPVATIAVSDRADPEAIRQAMRCGAVDFLTKPVHEDELVYALRRAARRLEECRCSHDERSRLAEPPDAGIEAPNAPEANTGKTAIRMACDYIREHYRDSFTLTEISERFGMSASYFSTQFKRTTGCSFIEYVNAIRIGKAKELLMRHNVMVYEVAHEVGFATVQYFNKIFKNAVRMTPGEFRKKLGVYGQLPLFFLTAMADHGFG
ncbi:helix-turn-helix domain-containing protein [Paenibacillus sp. MBLB4367]|uniref:helix-turn-helix domain-containing protein n=1 Tax=Paenibacillus sp. MBLB4367 TaxID=3384767 RepID=UPI0039083C17